MKTVQVYFVWSFSGLSHLLQSCHIILKPKIRKDTFLTSGETYQLISFIDFHSILGREILYFTIFCNIYHACFRAGDCLNLQYFSSFPSIYGP